MNSWSTTNSSLISTIKLQFRQGIQTYYNNKIILCYYQAPFFLSFCSEETFCFLFLSRVFDLKQYISYWIKQALIGLLIVIGIHTKYFNFTFSIYQKLLLKTLKLWICFSHLMNVVLTTTNKYVFTFLVWLLRKLKTCFVIFLNIQH